MPSSPAGALHSEPGQPRVPPAGAIESGRLLPLHAIWAMALLLAVAALWPLAAFPEIVAQDYPNHLARAFILLHRGDPLLAAHYRVDWLPIPDLGWDLWALAFGRIVSLEWAAKLLVLISGALTISGCFVLGRIIVGRWTAVPLLAFPFLFSAGYAKGFLSFDLGIGAALWAMAWWLWAPERQWAVRLLVAAGFSSLLYIVHFYAWAAYGIFVLGIELTPAMSSPGAPRLARLGTILRDGTQALPAFAMLWWSSVVPLRPMDPSKRAFGMFDLPWDRLGEAGQLINGDTAWGAVGLCAMGLALLLPFALGWARLNSRAAVPIALYVALFFALPNRIVDTYWVAWRVLLPATFLTIASTVPIGRWRRPVICAQVAVAALVTAAIPLLQADSWRQSERERADFIAAIAPIREGSRLFWAHSGVSKHYVVTHEIGAYHVGSYAVVAKRALVQSMFAYYGQQPLHFREDWVRNVPETSTMFLPEIVKSFGGSRISLAQFVERFDYVLMHGADDSVERVLLPIDHLQLINRVGDFRLYAVHASD